MFYDSLLINRLINFEMNTNLSTHENKNSDTMSVAIRNH